MTEFALLREIRIKVSKKIIDDIHKNNSCRSSQKKYCRNSWNDFRDNLLTTFQKKSYQIKSQKKILQISGKPISGMQFNGKPLPGEVPYRKFVYL